MKILLPALLFFALILRVHAGPEDPRLLQTDELWKEYTEAREALAEIPRPPLGVPDFSKKLGVWSDANRRTREAARNLLPPMVAMAADVPAEDYELIQVELQQIHRDLTGSPTPADHKNLRFIAETIHPQVRDKALPAERAGLFVELTKPDQFVRGGDEAARGGRITEPIGWSIQDTHALALARAGKFEEARSESDLLLTKVQIVLEKGRLPNLKMNHRGEPRAKTSLKREFLLHRALIEALAGNAKEAKDQFAEADKIKEPDADILKTQTALEKQISELTRE